MCKTSFIISYTTSPLRPNFPHFCFYFTFELYFPDSLVSLVAQLVKNPPAMWETWVRSLDWEDPLEKGKATHSSILAWRISWTIAPLSTGLSRQEYWSGLPCPPPGHIPNPGIKPRSPTLQADSLPTELQGKPNNILETGKKIGSC